MSSSTNPFLSGTATNASANPMGGAVAAQEETNEYQPHPNNPFLRSTSPPTQIPSQMPSQMQQTQIPSSNSNPFQTQATQPKQVESADTITQSLSGLDFGLGATSAPSVQPQTLATSSDPINPFSTQAPSQSINPMPAQYAPPPGPPPELAPSMATNSSQVQDDEAYARQVWAREEERERRRLDKQQRKQAYDPALAAVGGAPAFHPNGTVGPRIDSHSPLPPSRLASQGATTTTPPKTDEEKQWNTKEIYWKGRSQRIIVQNENGPCSLIALCNVLLLRGIVQITPEDRPAVSYSYLSSLLGEHLIDAISTQPGEAMDLGAALSILPQTQHGLDVNVKFSSIDGFAVESASTPIDHAGPSGSSSSAAVLTSTNKTDKNIQKGELALFKLCNVPLIHGWLADQSDRETWAAVVERAGDYDKALDRVVAGDEIAKQTNIGNVHEADFDIRAGEIMDALSSEQKVVVQDAMLIRKFLESTATQLTYPGLYALSTTLERGVLYALFRNSHLSVLYRPTEEELRQGQTGSEHDQPQLYQLVTDATLENEDLIVWESVEDVDGSASRFYDGKFKQATIQRDFARNALGGEEGGEHNVDSDADFAYAQQLQEQERQRADRHRRAVNTYRNRQQTQNQSSKQGGGGNMIARMLANRKSASKSTPSNAALQQNIHGIIGTRPPPGAQQDPYRSAPTETTNETGPGEEYTQKDGKKWWKKVF